MVIEDFTDGTWIEVDPNSRIDRTQTRVTFAGLTRAESAYVYKDKGVGYFNGDFEHWLDVRYSSCVLYSFVHLWGLFNTIGDREEAKGSPINYVGVYFGGEGTNNAKIVLIGYYNGVCPGAPQWVLPLPNTTYYLTIKRTGSTYTCDIYPTSSDRENETNALANLSITLGGVTAFQYIYVSQSMSYTGGYPIYGYVENLILHPVKPTRKIWKILKLASEIGIALEDINISKGDLVIIL